MDKHKFEILDCTIRDGGYLNNWNFDEKMVRDVYYGIAKSGVDIIEIGFRDRPNKERTGVWCSTPESIINKLFNGISGAAIALMVDLGKFDLQDIPLSSESLVKIYRVACHKDKVFDAIDVCKTLAKKGYKISIQLMGIDGYTDKEISDLIDPLKQSVINYVYFADSYGSLFPQDIKRYIEALRLTGKKIGFHAHNSLQFAFANTLEAIKNGVDIVDGTIYGMGRGAGNLPLEALIIYLEHTMNNNKYNVLPILDLIDRYFIGLHNELKWGYSLPYMLSGTFQVHPDYAKSLIDYHEYKVDDIVKALEVIKSLGPIGFKNELLEKVINSGFIGSLSKEEDSNHDFKEVDDLLNKYPVKYVNRHRDRDFLILANGPSLKEYKDDVDGFIRQYDPVIMGANYLGGLFKPHYHAFSNKRRFINYIDSVGKDSNLLISSNFEEDFISQYTGRNYEWLVHFNRVSSCFGINEGVITSNCRTVAILLIAAAIVMGAKRIFVAGLDGYKSKDNFLSNNVHFYDESEEAENFRILMEKHNWNETMLNSIDQYLLAHSKEGIHIITPTTHKYFYTSLHNWIG